MIISDCCGALAKGYEDIGLCSKCFEHCTYIDEEEEIPDENGLEEEENFKDWMDDMAEQQLNEND